jgi:hypothetical protein
MISPKWFSPAPQREIRSVVVVVQLTQDLRELCRGIRDQQGIFSPINSLRLAVERLDILVLSSPLPTSAGGIFYYLLKQ